MTVYQVLCLLGIPSIIGGITGFICKKVKDDYKKTDKETQALKLGMQALLRAQMINDFNKWSERKYAPIYARDNFINVYEQYHKLGANGVMDDIYEKFKSLPINPPESKTKNIDD